MEDPPLEQPAILGPDGRRLALAYPAELPVCAHREEILAALKRSPVVVVSGDTGSGKTTQLPKMALEFGARRIVCTQPRRLAAVTMAERVAAELRQPVGGLVGFQHRFGRRLSDDTRVKFATDGVLLAETRADPLLRAYDLVIIDEAHERSLNVDFLLGILKRILARRRDLRVIVSSATLDVDRFAAFFDGAPVVSVPGRLFPVEIVYRPPPPEEELDLPRAVASAVAELPAGDDVLVFLPGERDIRETADFLRDVRGDADEIIPLLASLPASEQQRAFRLSPRRRLVLATNVAETSVTIPGIRHVVDSGLARLSRYVPRTQIQRLQIEPVSQASARQRAGRCGRLAPGTCIRLYAAEDFAAREPFTPPEVLRSSLAGVVLALLDLGLGDVEDFPFIDPPKPAAIREGLRELVELSALAHDPVSHEVVLTRTGRQLARIPVEPRFARMLLAAADLGCLPDAIPLVAAMSCDDPRRRPADEREKAVQAHAPFRVPGSDFLGTLKLWRWWNDQNAALSQSKLRALAKKTYLSYPKMREWRDLAHQLESLCRRLHLSFTEAKGDDAARLLHRALLTGLLSRIGRYDEEARDYRGAHGLRFALHPSSVLAKKFRAPSPRPPESARAPKPPRPSAPPWIMAAELVDTTRLFARHAAAIDPDWLEAAAGPLCRRHCHSPEWDPSSGFVRATEQVTLYGLVIVPARRCDFARYDPARAREIFIRHALVEGEFPNPPPSVRDNLQLIAALRRRAERLRQSEAFDAERLAVHFARLLPPDVCSIPALRKWLRDPSHAIRLKKADWWPAESAAGASADFPETITLAGAQMHLSYRHAPEDPEADGITCTVFRSKAAALALWRADWLVPGALAEKMLFLLSLLPAAQRRILAPASEAVTRLMPRLRPGAEALVDSLRRALAEEYALAVDPVLWDAPAYPPHLLMRFRVRDDATGRNLLVTRDPAALAAFLAELSRPATAKAPSADAKTKNAASGEPKKGVWTFGAIPERTTDSRAGWKLEHFPALHDDGAAVTLRLYPDAAAAAAAHARGVARLFREALEKENLILFHRRRQLTPAALAHVKTLDYPDERIASDVFDGAIQEVLVRGRAPVRDAAEFAARGAAGRPALAETQMEIAKIFAESMDAAARVRERLADDERLSEETVDAVDTQLAWLLFRGFPRAVPLARLRHYRRYFKAIDVRLDRARNSPSSDRAKEALLAPHWERYRAAAAAAASFDAAKLAAYRWMIEEYRVSLFAQELHTSEPVSAKRLEALWDAL